MNTTSSSLDWTEPILYTILGDLYLYGGLILIVLGTVSSVINLAVFIQKNLRQQPCYIYFIARNIWNLFFIYLSLLYVTLVLGFNIFPNSSNLSYCHFSIYISLLCDTLSPFYLILASIDRFCITSSKANLRKRMTCRFACLLSFFGTIFWILFHIHALIYSKIVEIKHNSFHCDLQTGLYSTLVTYYLLIIKGILSPILLITFGILTTKNLRNTRRNTPVIYVIRIRKNSPKIDQQIFMILIKDIIVYLLFSSITAIVLMYELITQHHTKDFYEEEVEYFIRHLSTFCVSIPFCIGCYTNLIVSKIFRNEVKHILLCK
jgi:hypothetical protein